MCYKIPVFLCIGSKNSYYDGVAYRIGVKLKKRGYEVINDINNLNMKDKLKELDKLKEEKSKYVFIAIDLAIGVSKSPYSIIDSLGILPGSALGREHRRIGNKSIHINFNYHVKCDNNFDMLKELLKTEETNEKFDKTENEVYEYIIKNYI